MARDILTERKTMKWLKERSKKERAKIWALVVTNVIFSMISVLFALAIKQVIDGAVYGKTDELIGGAVSLVLMIILQFCLRLFNHAMSDHIKFRLEISYKSYIFDQVLAKDYKSIKNYHSGDLMNRITNDVAIVASGVTDILPAVCAAFARLLFAVVALIYLDWIFAIAFTVAGILVFLIISILRAKLKSLHKKAQETEGKTRSFMQECIENLLAIKVFSVNKEIDKKAEDLQEDNYKVKMKRAWYAVFGNASYNFVFSAGYLFALIYGAVKILQKAMAYGTLSAILQLVNNVQVPFASLSEAVPKYFSMIASGERLMEIEEIKDDVVEEIEREELYKGMKAIVVDNVTFAYDKERVLEKTSITINKGDFIAIGGSSGIGKSTLIKLLLGVYPIESGSIYVDGENGKREIDGCTRTLFSYVPQGNLVFSGTILDNLTFTCPVCDEQEIKNALDIACCSKFISELPDGVNTVVGEKGAGLSEGQIQRIAIARAILSNAPIMLLDESTSALDEETEKQLLSNLKELKDKTLIIISHKKAAANICNRKIKISAKKISEVK